MEEKREIKAILLVSLWVTLVCLFAATGCNQSAFKKVNPTRISGFYPAEMISDSIVTQIAPMKFPFKVEERSIDEPRVRPFRTMDGLLWLEKGAFDLSKGVKWELPGIAFCRSYLYNPKYSQYWVYDDGNAKIVVAEKCGNSLNFRECYLELLVQQLPKSDRDLYKSNGLVFLATTKDACFVSIDRRVFEINMNDETIEYRLALSQDPNFDEITTFLLPGLDSIACLINGRESILHLTNLVSGKAVDMQAINDVEADPNGNYMFLLNRDTVWSVTDVESREKIKERDFESISCSVLDCSTLEVVNKIPYSEILDSSIYPEVSTNFNADLRIFCPKRSKEFIFTRESGWQSDFGYNPGSQEPDRIFFPEWGEPHLFSTPTRVGGNYSRICGKTISTSLPSSFETNVNSNWAFSYLGNTLEIMNEKYLVSVNYPVSVCIFEISTGRKIYERLSTENETILEIYRKDLKTPQLGILVVRDGYISSRYLEIFENEVKETEIDYRSDEVAEFIEELKTISVDHLSCRQFRDINLPFNYCSDIPNLVLCSPLYFANKQANKINIYSEGKKIRTYDFPNDARLFSIVTPDVLFLREKMGSYEALFNLKSRAKFDLIWFQRVSPSFISNLEFTKYHALQDSKDGKTTLLVYSNSAEMYKYCEYENAELYSFVDDDHVILKCKQTHALFLTKLKRDGILVEALRIEKFLHEEK